MEVRRDPYEPIVLPSMAKHWLLDEERAKVGESGRLILMNDDTLTLSAYALHVVGVPMQFSEAYEAVAGEEAAISEGVLARLGQAIVDKYPPRYYGPGLI
jgi:hypothetical protein